jgi:hypothetical protein
MSGADATSSKPAWHRAKLWDVPVEVRVVEACTSEHPCVKAAGHDDQHHGHEDRLPAEYTLYADLASYQITGLS